jgi:hypothetical protein
MAVIILCFLTSEFIHSSFRVLLCLASLCRESVANTGIDPLDSKMLPWQLYDQIILWWQTTFSQNCFCYWIHVLYLTHHPVLAGMVAFLPGPLFPASSFVVCREWVNPADPCSCMLVFTEFYPPQSLCLCICRGSTIWVIISDCQMFRISASLLLTACLLRSAYSLLVPNVWIFPPSIFYMLWVSIISFSILPNI